MPVFLAQQMFRQPQTTDSESRAVMSCSTPTHLALDASQFLLSVKLLVESAHACGAYSGGSQCFINILFTFLPVTSSGLCTSIILEPLSLIFGDP
jgi:hypothetical protein